MARAVLWSHSEGQEGRHGVVEKLRISWRTREGEGVEERIKSKSIPIGQKGNSIGKDMEDERRNGVIQQGEGL